MPREHGAYAQVALPVVAGLLIARGASAAAALLVVGLVSAFLAREPLLVWLGRRGGRRQRELGEVARGRFVVLSLLALAATALGLIVASPEVHAAAMWAAPGIAVAAALVLSKRDATLPGESWIALTLAAASMPITVAAGASLEVSSANSLVWGVSFVLATATVHAILRRFKKKEPWPARVVAALALGVIATCVTFARSDAWWPLTMTPTAVVCFAACAGGVTPRRLKPLGWSLVAAQLGTLAALAALL